MVLGLGVDIIVISRMREILEGAGRLAFVSKTYTSGEQQRAEARPTPSPTSPKPSPPRKPSSNASPSVGRRGFNSMKSMFRTENSASPSPSSPGASPHLPLSARSRRSC